MRRIALVLMLCIGSIASAQKPAGEDPEHKVIGWDPTLPVSGNVSANATRHVHYSPARMKSIESFRTWVRQSYLPRRAVVTKPQ